MYRNYPSAFVSWLSFWSMFVAVAQVGNAQLPVSLSNGPFTAPTATNPRIPEVLPDPLEILLRKSARRDYLHEQQQRRLELYRIELQCVHERELRNRQQFAHRIDIKTGTIVWPENFLRDHPAECREVDRCFALLASGNGGIGSPSASSLTMACRKITQRIQLHCRQRRLSCDEHRYSRNMIRAIRSVVRDLPK